MKTYLEPADVELIENQATSLRDKLLVRLLFRLGCRVSEALAIKTSDIDFQWLTVTIVHLKVRSQLLCTQCKARLAKRHRFCPECGVGILELKQRESNLRRQRILPIDKETIELLREYIFEQLPVDDGMSRSIFRINRHRAWQIVRDCARRTGLPHLVNPVDIPVRRSRSSGVG